MARTPNFRASKATRRLVLVVLWLFVINYVLHVFGVSLSGLFELRFQTLAERYPREDAGDIQHLISRVSAWVEFCAINVIQLLTAVIIALFVVAREVFRFFRHGRVGLVLSAFTHSWLFVVPAATAFIVYQAFTGGPAAFTGTRLGVYPLPVLMFFIGVLTTASLVTSFLFAIDSREIQRAFDIGLGRRSSGSTD